MLTTSPVMLACRPGSCVSMPSHGRGVLLLQAERDALALAVDAQHLDLDLLVDLHHLATGG